MAQIFAAAVASGVSILLCVAAFDLVVIERDAGTVVALDIPVWVAQLAMPLGFGVIALRLVWRSSDRWWGRLLASTGLMVGMAIGLNPEWLEGSARWPWLLILVLATVLGGPIFTILGGAAVIAVACIEQDGAAIIHIAVQPCDRFRRQRLLFLGNRPIEQGIESQIVGFQIHAHGLARFHGGAPV